MPRRDEWVDLTGTSRAFRDQDVVLGGSIVAQMAGIFGLFFVWAATLAFVVIRRQVQETPQINLEKRAIRIKLREFTFDEIRGARLEIERPPGRNGPSWHKLALILEVTPRLALRIPLRDGESELVSPTVREKLAEAIAGSEIDIPRDRYDPKGRFARSGSPSHVTKDEARELVENPPPAGGSLPH